MTSVYEDPTTWRLQTGGTGVPYRIVGMSGTFEPESASANMELLVPANKLVQFATEMFPAVRYDAFGFPIFPSFGRIHGTPLFSRKISWKAHIDGKPVDPFGIDPSAPEGTYQDTVLCSVDFETMNEQDESTQDPETFLEISCTGGGHFIHTGAPGAQWWVDESTEEANDGLKAVGPEIPLGMSVPTVDWDLSWPRVPYTYWTNVLIAKIRAALGQVNSVAMPIFANAPRGTILFVGYTLRKSYTWRAGVTTQQPFNLAMKFQEKRVVDADGIVRGHNDFWKPGIGWRYLKHKDGSPVYRYSNLTGIFTP